MLLLFTLITVWLWICLPIFWGSTYLLTEHFPNLAIHLVTFDTASNSYLNGPMTEMAKMQASLPKQQTHLGWSVRDTSDYPNGLDDVEANVLSQRSWATVVVNANATSAWTQAVQNGDASYDPTGAITVYLQSARFYQVTLLYIEQLVSGTLVRSVPEADDQVSTNIMSALTTARASALQDLATSLQGNDTAVAAARQVPQAVGTGFGFTIHDLRSIGNGGWAGAAPMEAGMIYYVRIPCYANGDEPLRWDLGLTHRSSSRFTSRCSARRRE